VPAIIQPGIHFTLKSPHSSPIRSLLFSDQSSSVPPRSLLSMDIAGVICVWEMQTTVCDWELVQTFDQLSAGVSVAVSWLPGKLPISFQIPMHMSDAEREAAPANGLPGARKPKPPGELENRYRVMGAQIGDLVTPGFVSVCSKGRVHLCWRTALADRWQHMSSPLLGTVDPRARISHAAFAADVVVMSEGVPSTFQLHVATAGPAYGSTVVLHKVRYRLASVNGQVKSVLLPEVVGRLRLSPPLSAFPPAWTLPLGPKLSSLAFHPSYNGNLLFLVQQYPDGSVLQRWEAPAGEHPLPSGLPPPHTLQLAPELCTALPNLVARPATGRVTTPEWTLLSSVSFRQSSRTDPVSRITALHVSDTQVLVGFLSGKLESRSPDLMPLGRSALPAADAAPVLSICPSSHELCVLSMDLESRLRLWVRPHEQSLCPPSCCPIPYRDISSSALRFVHHLLVSFLRGTLAWDVLLSVRHTAANPPPLLPGTLLVASSPPPSSPVERALLYYRAVMAHLLAEFSTLSPPEQRRHHLALQRVWVRLCWSLGTDRHYRTSALDGNAHIFVHRAFQQWGSSIADPVALSRARAELGRNANTTVASPSSCEFLPLEVPSRTLFVSRTAISAAFVGRTHLQVLALLGERVLDFACFFLWSTQQFCQHPAPLLPAQCHPPLLIPACVLASNLSLFAKFWLPQVCSDAFPMLSLLFDRRFLLQLRELVCARCALMRARASVGVGVGKVEPCVCDVGVGVGGDCLFVL
jgi:hypothetical protein